MSTGSHFITHRAVKGRYLSELREPFVRCLRQNVKMCRARLGLQPFVASTLCGMVAPALASKLTQRHSRSKHEIDSCSLTLLRALAEALYES